MTWVKICGMTNLEDALTAVDAGADAVGFVFYEKSPRNIRVEVARQIVQELPEGVEKVGVFVDQSAQQVTDISDRVGLSAVQVYLLDSDGARFFADLPPNKKRRTFLAIPGERVTSGEAFEISFFREFLSRTSALFLDSGNRQQPGGTGKVFDWRRAADTVKAISEIIPIVIAGGLSTQNVGEAIDVFNPWGVDVASGVEARPGKKDSGKVRAFVRAVREADRKAS
ncbi:MAG: phosphoribosylanthranilate isomerase [Candidatus Sulfotelmatobacter sp.]